MTLLPAYYQQELKHTYLNKDADADAESVVYVHHQVQLLIHPGY